MTSLKDLIKNKPPAVQETIRRALAIAKTRASTIEHHLEMIKLLLVALKGPPSPLVILPLLAEVIGYLEHLERERNHLSRREGTAAGLRAYEESLRAGPKKEKT